MSLTGVVSHPKRAPVIILALISFAFLSYGAAANLNILVDFVAFFSLFLLVVLDNLLGLHPANGLITLILEEVGFYYGLDYDGLDNPKQNPVPSEPTSGEGTLNPGIEVRDQIEPEEDAAHPPHRSQAENVPTSFLGLFPEVHLGGHWALCILCFDLGFSRSPEILTTAATPAAAETA